MEVRTRMSGLWQQLKADRQLVWLSAIIALFCLVYVGFALTPSSYAAGLEWLGLSKKGLILGHPQAIRSDEWIVFTPYVQIAVANGFAHTNAISPYHEDLRSFLSLPIADWALLFKPYYWGFFVLPPANAYSLYFLWNTLAFVIGWTLLLRQFRMDVRWAALTALALYFSQFVQVWWTSNSGVFAYAPWPALAWLYFGHRGMRIAATAYALIVWLLSCAYPPFVYASALAIGVLLLACRPDAISRARLLDACISASIALGIFIAYFGHLIDVMQNTVYPGHRESMGGGIEHERLFAHIYPFFAIDGYEPLSILKQSNACEVAILSTLLPLFAICLADYAHVRELVRRHMYQVGVAIAGLAFIAIWLTLPITGLPAKITGLFMVPPNRMLLGFGLLLNVAAAVVLATARLKLSVRRLSLILFALIASAVGKWRHAAGTLSAAFSWHEGAMLVVVIALCVYLATMAASEHRQKLAIFGAAALVNLLAFGLFNPVQSAYPIFSLDREQLRTSLSERGAIRVGNYYAVPGQYGALLAGAGIPTINHVLLHPELGFFKPFFPDMDSGDFNDLFNRYEHVSLSEEEGPRLAGPDHIYLPIAAFTGHGAIRTAPRPAFTAKDIAVSRLSTHPTPVSSSPPAAFGYIDTVTRNGRSVSLQGWIHTPADKANIQIWIASAAGPIQAVTVRRPDVARLVDPALLDSGVGITLNDVVTDRQEICILVRAQDGTTSTVRFPDGSWMCSRLP